MFDLNVFDKLSIDNLFEIYQKTNLLIGKKSMDKLTEAVLSSKNFAEYNEKANYSIYKGSIFENIYALHSRTKGSFGEKITAEILGMIKSSKEGGDIIEIDKDTGAKIGIEVKLSCFWENREGKLCFEQIRKGNYKKIIFLVIEPNRIRMWEAPYKDLENNIFDKDEYRQHNGKDGNTESYWIQTNSYADIPTWFREIYLTR
jgi:hypothetical protein